MSLIYCGRSKMTWIYFCTLMWSRNHSPRGLHYLPFSSSSCTRTGLAVLSANCFIAPWVIFNNVMLRLCTRLGLQTMANRTEELLKARHFGHLADSRSPCPSHLSYSDDAQLMLYSRANSILRETRTPRAKGVWTATCGCLLILQNRRLAWALRNQKHSPFPTDGSAETLN